MRRAVFDATLAAYAAAFVTPVVGEYAGAEAYVGTTVGFWFVAYLVVREIDSVPERVARRPTATVFVTAPLVYGFVYVVGTVVAEPPVRSPYVYLGLWNVVVGVAVVAVARRVSRR